MPVSYFPYLIPQTGDVNVTNDVEGFLKNFVSSHASDHRSMFTFMNSLLNAVDPSNPVLHFSETDMLFNVNEINDFNNFLLTNNRQHKIIYDKINALGAQAVPIFYVYPIHTNWLSIVRVDKQAVSQFAVKENQVHMMIMRSANLLAQALQYVP